MKRDELLPEEYCEVDGRRYPKIAGRLRLVHACNRRTSIEPHEVEDVPGVRAKWEVTVTTDDEILKGTGTASAEHDKECIGALAELAETRALARALRWGGYGGFEVSAEEMLYRSGKVLQTEKPPELAPAPQAPQSPPVLRVVKPDYRQTSAPRAMAPNGPKASTKQVGKVCAILRRMGLRKNELIKQFFQDNFGVSGPEELSMKDIGSAIEQLMKMEQAQGNVGLEAPEPDDQPMAVLKK
jgi:hypothetical protein